MKHGLRLALFLVLLTFIVSACANYQNPFQKKEKEEVGRGIKLSFASNTIPDVIYVGRNFPLSVVIENYGKSVSGELLIYDQIDGGIEVESIAVTLEEAGFVPDTLGRIRGKIVPDRKSYPDERMLAQYNEGDFFEGARANIHAELKIDRYSFNEKFPLCIKEEDVQGVPCSNNEIETFSDMKNQFRDITYSPVTITRIEKTVTPLGDNEYFISLDITLENVGGGEIINSEVGDDLTVKGNAISTPNVIFGSVSLECSPRYEVVFVNNKAVLNCAGTTVLGEGQEYVEKIIEISYDYGYKMKIKKGPIPIVKR